MNARACRLIMLVLVAWNGRALAQSPNTPQGNDWVILREAVTTDYAKSPGRLTSTVRDALPDQVKVHRGDSISSIIFKQYGVDAKHAEAAYQILQGNILERNGLSSDALIAGHQLDVPDLPKMALRNPNDNNPYNALATSRPKLADKPMDIGPNPKLGRDKVR